MKLTKRIALKYIRTKFRLLGKLDKKKAAEKAFQLFISPQSRVKKEPSRIFLHAEKIQLDFAGTRVSGYKWNHPSEKKLLILHGFESSILNFGKYIQPLINQGYEVLGFDAPAHGCSGGSSINAVDYKNFILFLNEKLGPIKNFITHSFGGLGLGLALEELPHDETFRVVFIAPATESTTAIRQFFNLLQLDKDVQLEFNELITRANNKKPEWYSVARAADNIKAQVLFLQDKMDVLTPYEDVLPIIKKNYPNFRFIITEGLGHKKIYKDTASIQAVTNFFK